MGLVYSISDPRTATVTIADGASLSDAAACPNLRQLCGVITPANWTTAGVSFQVSYDFGTTYVVMWTDSGAEYTIAAVPASRYVAVDPVKFMGVTNVKVQSGTSGATTAQAGGDTVTLVFR